MRTGRALFKVPARWAPLFIRNNPGEDQRWAQMNPDRNGLEPLGARGFELQPDEVWPAAFERRAGEVFA